MTPPGAVATTDDASVAPGDDDTFGCFFEPLQAPENAVTPTKTAHSKMAAPCGKRPRVDGGEAVLPRARVRFVVDLTDVFVGDLRVHLRG